MKLFKKDVLKDIGNPTTTKATIFLFYFIPTLIWGKNMKKNPVFTVSNFLFEKNSTCIEVKGKKNKRSKLLVCDNNSANVHSSIQWC